MAESEKFWSYCTSTFTWLSVTYSSLQLADEPPERRITSLLCMFQLNLCRVLNQLSDSGKKTMWRTKFLAVTLLLLALAKNTEPWRRRRRSGPPPCPTRNCQVGSWSSWGACSRQCGTSGTQSRRRSKTVVETCGGTCHYPLSQNRACNRDACKNSGTPHSSGCSCRPGFRGTCCESGKLKKISAVA